jgi:hypothetical protein
MSKIGYYRYKVSDSVEGESSIKFFVNGGLYKTCTIIAKQFCPGFRILKYINTDGQYRFFPFNKFYQISNKPTLIGKVNQFVTSITDSQGSEKNIGYKNEKKITLTAERCTLDELEKLESIYSSPRVYLYVGNGYTDNLQDWLLVTVTGDGISKAKKANFKKIVLEVTLPQQHAITKI